MRVFGSQTPWSSSGEYRKDVDRGVLVAFLMLLGAAAWLIATGALIAEFIWGWW